MTIIHNDTIDTLLNRRSIRAFTDESITDDERETLEVAAQRSASSQYLNDFTALRIEDPSLKQALADLGGQAYIAKAPLLYIFVADEYRNATIAQRKGVDTQSDAFALASSARLIQVHNDAVLALHAMETAAFSLNLGCVILGCILNDTERLIELLNLPRYTFPVLGLAIGHPDQSPELKPRMSRDAQFFVNTYPDKLDDSYLADFDRDVHQYYDLRQADRPVDAFSDQIAKVSQNTAQAQQDIVAVARKQGFRFNS